jgi:hypothetical protein
MPPGHLGLDARFSATCHLQITPAHWFAPATNTRHGLAVGSLDNKTPKVIKEKKIHCLHGEIYTYSDFLEAQNVLGVVHGPRPRTKCNKVCLVAAGIRCS